MKATALEERISMLALAGLLQVECTFCNGKIKRAELFKMNLCEYCDSEIEALPSKDESCLIDCQAGKWRSTLS